MKHLLFILFLVGIAGGVAMILYDLRQRTPNNFISGTRTRYPKPLRAVLTKSGRRTGRIG